ncbi:TPA: non-hydrolyzing UDP-N-acetylglucosamine 2-epimerase [Staphylococcus argenteus]|uniref:UDP-N-acetylglucosamine 2-epimerase (non-hydrolyzing) n=1 Tax=Staphylococcus argenteus TaxID=985002 RepID=A0A7U7PWN2_9STAP|nr:UDP-N-acetylglucosamine 2-epimerase (non-hydrolyzing) [Staphylococcus argenteus]BBN31579.1 UDP-N-acetylglucosamine 2-epimerase [Staphylococcus aureus]ATY57576.1 UDP-N-acetylglucosamine 2-epimerase (non-hydrolyzing) [Staphylococcus argenteus]ATZ87799.1 UDP-N-acetylglucosamine 2-epimerase (non-hydrolyzing) [Staphylococcus argenteus]EKF1505639.1 UDP-N-acetylglucosamine 2-epimerase (non-hydrolyzing) [Staphylococcus argenteus]EYG91816.1 UDP-N-acetylglucosamine 2-epimerase [Staphylococcus argente
MKKIMTVFGTRPEAIKMAPLVKALEKDDMLEPIVVVTAQHREMLDSVLETFEIKPKYDLNIMKSRQTLSEITSKSITQLEQVIHLEKPDMVLVHGDTMTTFAGGLAAFYNQVPVGHVEAGLRSYDKYSPFPEEMNRQLVGVITDLHFAPTKNAAKHLLNEGKKSESVVVTGNTAIDAMKYTVDEDYKSNIIDQYRDKKFILMTAHRRENIGKPMENIFKAVKRLVDENTDLALVYPMHKNPQVRKVAQKILGNHERIELIEPLDVLDFHNFAKQAYFILTDSGGIQEEAPSFNKPVLVLRNVTERPEGVEAGTLKVVGTNEEDVYQATKQLINDNKMYHQMSEAHNPYGDGFASERIVNHIKYYLNLITEKPSDFN